MPNRISNVEKNSFKPAEKVEQEQEAPAVPEDDVFEKHLENVLKLG